MKLTREVRMTLDTACDQPVHNSWAGWPASDQLVPTVDIRFSVRGQISSQTGMICDIKGIDQLMRRVVPQVRFEGLRGGAYARELWQALVVEDPAMQPVQLEVAITPRLRFRISEEAIDMVTLVQQFEFSAAHRLHCEQLSDEENREMFGKCNYPNGHGHNYVLEVSVSGPLSETGEVIRLTELQALVKRQIVDRFDHKHLNRDCEEFAQLNPTVENIARRCWELLEGHFDPAQLTRLRLYETPKTWVDLDMASMGGAD